MLGGHGAALGLAWPARALAWPGRAGEAGRVGSALDLPRELAAERTMWSLVGGKSPEDAADTDTAVCLTRTHGQPRPAREPARSRGANRCLAPQELLQIARTLPGDPACLVLGVLGAVCARPAPPGYRRT
ncbi:hypothetical protein QFZ76_009505 [Streptomyces sp. V4I2]|nr:hypothetical protein [Streptomyces sp. V4I2]